MARKTSRRRQTTRRRTTSQPAPRQTAGSSAASAPPAPASAAARVEMALGARPQGGRQRKAVRQVLVEDSDPGIPLNQVPFFSKDLRRLGITVAVMIVLMLVGAQVLLHFWG